MKKQATFTVLTLALTAGVYAQTPVQQTKSAVFEFSDTWCTPCGAYAVDVADSLEVAMLAQNKGYLIGVKTTSTPATLNAVGGFTMYTNFACDAVPSFIINNSSIDEGVTHNNPADVARMLQHVTTFDSLGSMAGIAADGLLSGTTLSVTAKSKFWNATTGDYYMSVLVAEDHISATQTAYPNNPCIHTNVMRGPMATNGTALATDPWGESVGTTSIPAGQEFTKTYMCDLDPSWNNANIVAFAVIFKKKTDGTYETVNIEKVAGISTGIDELSIIKDISVYPNPATDKVNVAINAPEYLKLDMSITDAQGRIVYSQKDIAVNKGDNDIQINTGGLPGGSYIVTISDDKMGVVTRSIVIR